MAVRSAFCALALGTSALTAGAVFAPSAAEAIIVWDWSVAGTGTGATSGSITGSGTFTTNGDTPTVGTTYTVTGATGSFTGDVPGTFSILEDLPISSSTTLQWSGESTNQLLLMNNIGLSGPQQTIGLFSLSNDFSPADSLTIFIFRSTDPCGTLSAAGVCNYSLTSASLTPQSAPEPIPGPLPVLGAGAAFGFSRRLRRRISASQATPPQA